MIRVLRVLEYTYRDAEAMANDQARWYMGTNGSCDHGHVAIRSATMPLEFVEDKQDADLP